MRENFGVTGSGNRQMTSVVIVRVITRSLSGIIAETALSFCLNRKSTLTRLSHRHC